MDRTVLLSVLVSSVSSALVAFALGALASPPVSRAAPGQQAPAPVVRAQRFELVDAQGTVRAQLGVLERDVIGLAVLEPGGQPRAVIGLESDGTAGVLVADPSGQPRVGLGVDRNSSAGLRLHTAQGNSTTLSAEPDGSSGLTLADATGLRTGLILTTDARPGWFFRDPTGEQRASLFLAGDGAPSIVFANPQGPLVHLGMLPDGRTGFDVVERGGPRGAALHLRPDGTPAVELRDQQGTRIGLAETPEGTGLLLLDSSPAVRAGMVLANEAATVAVRNTDGAAAVLTAQPNGTVTAGTTDAAGHARARLGLSPEGTAVMELGDDLGNPESARVALAELPDGARGLVVTHESGAAAVIGVSADGRPSVGMQDDTGHPRARLELRANGAPTMQFLGETGQVLWEAP
jgi:hypothetical protein